MRVHHVRGEGVRGGGRGQRRQRPRLRRYPGGVPVDLALQAGRVQEDRGGGEGEEEKEVEAGLKNCSNYICSVRNSKNTL